ncbi:hypothetical protein LTR91_001318 [Friedmanniomyces endolithicus]|uniref:Uncharacterized protein n=1 Tax=Friedmanniomyces endolithicus TaxID=329885 RepID=A0AAN6L1D7_9PEZI|nr:hypothetical protein LTS09_004772 [Friedmanniomyces endolithicus]KAK0272945.1 hypothetical protein LTR35_012616 [Friedmanniomyces endolithicus]KAK0283860.1 hypothetical protein LTS00_011523 [Friedmanniomyces endolithicus]KAK0320428.1 hypothetical protein LTR82_008543 [Friedmanniomyces endolithicus]KAK0929803.1 hypothetical protein LTR57_001660 [Friedmanniomyces endolithicus]
MADEVYWDGDEHNLCMLATLPKRVARADQTGSVAVEDALSAFDPSSATSLSRRPPKHSMDTTHAHNIASIQPFRMHRGPAIDGQSLVSPPRRVPKFPTRGQALGAHTVSSQGPTVDAGGQAEGYVACGMKEQTTGGERKLLDDG